MKPVYIINGFLDSGKTEFITYTLGQPYFQVRGKTLLIVCEEGENEYDDKLLKKSNTILELIDEEEEFTSNKLMELEKKYERLSRNSKLKLLYFARDYVSNVENNRDDKIIHEDKFYLDNIDKVDDFSNKEINKTLIRRKN